MLIINKEIVPEYIGLIGAGLPANAVASLQLLKAEPVGGGADCPPGYSAVGMCAFGDVSLGGQTFGPFVVGVPGGDATTTGVLAPPSHRCEAPLPRNCLIGVRGAGTTVTVPPASALLMTAP